ncbi:hypothetical protein ACEPPN_001672 [Leptodophora sp. 'Broadleaf-Isolate-01']
MSHIPLKGESCKRQKVQTSEGAMPGKERGKVKVLYKTSNVGSLAREDGERGESDDDDIDFAELLEGLVTAFTIEWLKAENSLWPEVADVKLQTFMHNREFYVHYDYSGGPTLDLIDILRKGSEIETQENGLLYVEF